MRDTVEEREGGPTHSEIGIAEEGEKDGDGVLQQLVNGPRLTHRRHPTPRSNPLSKITQIPTLTSSDIVNFTAVIIVQRTWIEEVF